MHTLGEYCSSYEDAETSWAGWGETAWVPTHGDHGWRWRGLHPEHGDEQDRARTEPFTQPRAAVRK